MSVNGNTYQGGPSMWSVLERMPYRMFNCIVFCKLNTLLIIGNSKIQTIIFHGLQKVYYRHSNIPNRFKFSSKIYLFIISYVDKKILMDLFIFYQRPHLKQCLFQSKTVLYLCGLMVVGKVNQVISKHMLHICTSASTD